MRISAFTIRSLSCSSVSNGRKTSGNAHQAVVERCIVTEKHACCEAGGNKHRFFSNWTNDIYHTEHGNGEAARNRPT